MHNHGTLLTLAAIAGCSSLPNVMVTIGFNMFDPSHKISKHISIYQQKEHAKTHRTPKGYNSKVLLKEIYIYYISIQFHLLGGYYILKLSKTPSFSQPSGDFGRVGLQKLSSALSWSQRRGCTLPAAPGWNNNL